MRFIFGLLGVLIALASPAEAQFNQCGSGFCPGQAVDSGGGFPSAGAPVAVTPTEVSASIRARMPYNIGASGALNVTSARVYDSPVVTVTNPQIEYSNNWANAVREGAGQEQCVGTQVVLKASILTGVNATQANTAAGYNQSGATLTSFGWTNVTGDAAGYIMKLDETAAPQTFASRTWAQMQSDGGAISGNTLTVPSCYYVRSDVAAVSIPGGTFYALQTEEDRPPQQTSSVASMTGTTVSITVPTTARYRTGDKLALASFTPATYNTVASAPVPITVVNGTDITLELKQSVSVTIASPGVVTDPSHGSLANDELTLTWVGGTPPTGLTSGGTVYVKTVVDANSYSVSATPGGAVINTSGSQSGLVTRRKSNLGTVTGLGNVQAQKPLIVRAQSTVASLGFGDIQATNATTAIAANTSTNWSAVSTATTVDGVNSIYVARITGTSSLGKKSIGLIGNSIADGSNDMNQADPSGAFFKGDAFGAVGPFKRALRLAGYPFFAAAVPTTLAGTEVTFGGGLVRQWVVRGSRGLLAEHVHNDVFAVANLAALQTVLRSYNTTYRAAVPTSTKLIAVTPSPTTAQVTSSKWNARTAGAQSQTGAFIFPTGFAYTYRDYLLGALNPGIGDPDGSFDFAQYISNALTGSFVAVDGYWPADGTNYWGTGDGTHLTLNTAAAVAPPMAAAIPSRFGF